MSTVNIDPTVRRRMQPNYSCRNGQLVGAKFQSELCALANQIGRYYSKEYFRSSGDVTAPIDDKLWRFSGWIGPMAGTMVARVLMAPSTQVTSTSNPYVQLNLYDTSGTLLTTGRAHFGYSYGLTPTEIPHEWGPSTIVINTSAWANTGFRATLQANDEARPISCTVYECSLPSDTDNGYLNQKYSVGAPVLDTDRSALVEFAHALYNRGGPTLFAFSSQTDATAPSNATATYRNLFYDAGLVAADRQGFLLDLRYSNRETKTTVPTKIDCFAGMSAGSGTVRVVDDAGTVYASFSVSGAAAWQTTAVANLIADRRMYYVEHVSDGVNTITTYAVTCYRYA